MYSLTVDFAGLWVVDAATDEEVCIPVALVLVGLESCFEEYEGSRIEQTFSSEGFRKTPA